MEMNNCRRCGAELSDRNGGYACANGHRLYANPAPTAGIFLLTPEGDVLVSVRGIEPGKGGLDTIGGFVDDNESFEQAIEREILEETGLRPNQYSPLTYLTSAPSTYNYGGETRNVLSCFFYATLTANAAPTASDDVAELITVPLGNLSPEKMWSNDTRIAVKALLAVTA